MEAYFILPKLISLLWEGALVCTYLFRRAVQCITTEEMRVLKMMFRFLTKFMKASWEHLGACVRGQCYYGSSIPLELGAEMV